MIEFLVSGSNILKFILALGAGLSIGSITANIRNNLNIPVSQKEIKADMEITLKEALETLQFTSRPYEHSGMVEHRNEKGKKEYTTEYVGKINVGIEELPVPKVDNKTKVITITMPEIKVLKKDIDPGTIHTIFEKKKYDKIEKSYEIHALCLEDLEASFSETAKQQFETELKDSIKEVVKKVLTNDYKDYTIRIE